MYLQRFPKAYRILALIILFMIIRVCYYWASDGFNVQKIENTFPIEEAWNVPPPNNQELKSLHTICSQKFIYLGKGSQAYAFLSEDGSYVLKLFKCYHLKPAVWLEKIPLFGKLDEIRNAALAKRRRKIDTSLKSYKIVSEMLQEECGLIYLQILPSTDFHQPITIVDKVKRSYSLDLAHYGFIIQKRADLIYPKLSMWIEEKNINAAKEALQSLIGLIVRRSLKGVQDSDPDLHKNAGLIGTTAIFIDLGSFHYNEAAKTEQVYITDIRKITKKLHDWLTVQSPELSEFFEKEIQNAPFTTWEPPS